MTVKQWQALYLVDFRTAALKDYYFLGEGMSERKGEKIGWIIGFIGAFIWVFVLSMVFVFQGKLIEAASGFLIVLCAVLLINFFAPWRHSSTPYWKLMVLPYLLFLLSIPWALWSFDAGIDSLDLNWWSYLWLIPTLIPFGILSRRSWDDYKKNKNS